MTALYFLGFIVSAIIFRIVFSIGTIVRNLQGQTKLLALMAEKLGCERDDIIKIMGKSNMPKQKKDLL